MSTTIQRYVPADARELVEIVQAAVGKTTPLEIVGGGTKRGIGAPCRTTMLVSTERFNQIIDYDPSELVLTVGAGAKLGEIEALLASREQMFAFEPFDFADMGAESSRRSTIGGVVAAGLAGSRRVSAGNVRDHVLGFSAVSGRGEAFIAGGHVVKNVTGYDLSKLMCGSWGQLAVLTEITLKVLPRPRVTLTVVADDLDEVHAFSAMSKALRSHAAIAAAAYIPRGLIDTCSHTLLRLEGFGPSVGARYKVLQSLMPTAALHKLEAAEGNAMWERVCNGALLGLNSISVRWRVNVPATSGTHLMSILHEWGGKCYADWGGALVHAQLPISVVPDELRAAVDRLGGHAMLVHAPDDYRTKCSALHPERQGVAALTQRVKAAFDPTGILDPLRFADSTA